MVRQCAKEGIKRLRVHALRKRDCCDKTCVCY